MRSGSNWNLKMLVLWRDENRRTRRKTLGAGTRTNNKVSPHMTPSLGIEPGPHWWEASALTTAPSLLRQICYKYVITVSTLIITRELQGCLLGPNPAGTIKLFYRNFLSSSSYYLRKNNSTCFK